MSNVGIKKMWFKYGKTWLEYKKYYWNIKDVIKVQKCDTSTKSMIVIQVIITNITNMYKINK